MIARVPTRVRQRGVRALLLSTALCVLHPVAVSLLFRDRDLVQRWATGTPPLMIFTDAPVLMTDGTPRGRSQLQIVASTPSGPSYGKTLLALPHFPSLATGSGYHVPHFTVSGEFARWTPPVRMMDRRGRAYMHTLGYGWPFVSIACDYEDAWTLPANATMPVMGLPVSGIEIPRARPVRIGSSNFPRAVPTRPVWSGFALNVLVWTAGAYAALFASGTLWRARTGKRRGWRWGACPACGYDVREQDRCPECGETRPARGARRTAGRMGRSPEPLR